MAHQIIAQKVDKRKFTALLMKEYIDTTLQLVHLPDDKFGISYQCHFYGVKEGKRSGGPFEVSGNAKSSVQQNPEVVLEVCNFQKTDCAISMDILITIDLPIVGTKTIYDQTLGGSYTTIT